MPRINNILVLKARVKARFDFDGYTWEWVRVTAQKYTNRGHTYWRARQQIVSEHKAHEIIEKFGLTIAHKDSDGEVYDSPNKSFRNTFKDKLQISTL